MKPLKNMNEEKEMATKEVLFRLFVGQEVVGYEVIETKRVHRGISLSIYDMIFKSEGRHYHTRISSPNTSFIGSTEFTDPCEVQAVEIKKLTWRPIAQAV